MIHIPRVDFVSRDLNTLDPEYKKKADAFVSKCTSLGLSILIYCTFRSPYAQALLYANGRTEDMLKKAAQKLTWMGYPNLGELLYIVSPKPGAPTVTWALPGQSAHQHGLAFDYVPTRNSKPVWGDELEEDLSLWLKAEAVASEVGLKRLRFERPHLEDPTFEGRREELMAALYSGVE